MNRIDDGLWELNRPLRRVGIELGHRMTVVRLSDGRLLVHSPVELDPELVNRLARLGPVGWIVAPSRFHDLYLRPWVERYPGAPLCAARGLEQSHPQLPCQPLLDEGLRSAWAPDLEMLPVEGMPGVNEVVFLHRPGRTLIVADLLFNLGRVEGLLPRIVTSMLGLRGDARASRLYRAFIRDRRRFRASLEQILDLGFDRLVPGHGRIIESGAREALRAAYRAGLRE